MADSRHIAAFSVLALVAGLGCISSPVIAPSDGQIILSANPVSVTLDEFAVSPVTTATVVVTAQILSMNGVPQSNVSLTFSASGGTLASGGGATTPLETDDNGFASDTLTLVLGDPDNTTVTVRSGGLSQTIDIAKTEIAPNQLPFAFVDITPGGSALLNQTVVYDGSSSADPDGDLITCYRWEIETSQNILNPELPCIPSNSRCEVIQGMSAALVTRSYAVEQGIVVATLQVTDDPAISCPDLGPTVPVTGFGLPAFDSHSVVCDRSAPTAGAGANQTLSLGMNAMVTVPINGATSFDFESGIASYAWDCGNGTGAQTGVAITCDYTTTGTFVVTLTVTNGCGMTGVDTVIVTVNP